MVRQIEPTIAKPTLTGIFRKAPNTNETTEDAKLVSHDSSDWTACFNPDAPKTVRCGDTWEMNMTELEPQRRRRLKSPQRRGGACATYL